jgi:hypothetical protein
MGMNPYIQDQMLVERRQAVSSEIERAHMIAALSQGRPGVGRRAIGKLGKSLVVFGLWLERAEQSSNHAFRNA